MTVVELEPAAERMAVLISDVPDEMLDAPTPCPEYTLGDLIDHVGSLTLAFTAAATKSTTDVGSQAPSGDASRLGDALANAHPAGPGGPGAGVARPRGVDRDDPGRAVRAPR